MAKRNKLFFLTVLIAYGFLGGLAGFFVWTKLHSRDVIGFGNIPSQTAKLHRFYRCAARVEEFWRVQSSGPTGRGKFKRQQTKMINNLKTVLTQTVC